MHITDTSHHKGKHSCYRKNVVRVSALLLFAAFWLLSVSADAANPKKKKDDGPIILDHADEWIFDQFDNPDAQRLSGNVQLRHAGMKMTCDSAVYYESSQSIRAFGHVHITQGDTLSLKGDSLHYDGSTHMSEMMGNVIVKHRNQTLKTQQLYYSRDEGKAWYPHEGELIDGKNHLQSYYGEYYTQKREAYFEDPDYARYEQDEKYQGYPVTLKGDRGTVVTPRLFYNAITKVARVEGRTNIISGTSKIFTKKGTYNTQTGRAMLDSYSRLKDDVRNYMAEGESLDYNKTTGHVIAKRNVVFKDFKNKCTLKGDLCEYFENTAARRDSSYVVGDRAVAIDYSNGKDTLYLHADTLRMYSYNTKTDTAYRVIKGYHHARAFRTDIQAVGDSLVYNTRQQCISLYRDPIVWADNRQVLGEEINVFTNDSTVDSIYVRRQALLVERLDNEKHYNQISGKLMRAYFQNGEMVLGAVDENVCMIMYPLEKDSTIAFQNYAESAKLRLYMSERKMQKAWTPAANGTLYPVGTAPEEKTFLPNFAWFDKVRPKDKDDIYKWKPKDSSKQLKATPRREAPLQTLKNNSR